MQIFGNIAKYFVRAVKKEKEKYVNKTLIYIDKEYIFFL